MNTPMISVVIPVYKVEKYLQKCVESVRNQTYTNLEIILVEDGSPDCCPSMCDEFSQADERIRVIHKLNGGLSDARNAGTLQAKGEYITYVDGDDYIDSFYVEYLYFLLQKYHAEMSICCMRVFTEMKIEPSKGKSEDRAFTAEQALEQMLYQKTFDTSAWGKLYMTSQMRKTLYPKGRTYEDLFTTYKIILQCRVVAYGERQLYFYLQRATSIMAEPFSLKTLDLKVATDELFGYISKKHPLLIPAATSRRFSSYCQLLKKIETAPTFATLKQEVWETIKKDRSMVVRNSHCRRKNRLAALCSYMGKTFFLYIYGMKYR